MKLVQNIFVFQELSKILFNQEITTLESLSGLIFLTGCNSVGLFDSIELAVLLPSGNIIGFCAFCFYVLNFMLT